MRLLHFFIFSNIYVALPVCALAAETYLLFDLPVSFNDLSFIYCSTLFLYSFHRYIGVVNIGIDDLTTNRMQWSKNNLKTILFITILSGALSFMFFIKMEHIPILTIIPCTVIALGYSIPIFLKNGSLIRLRDINGIKIILIAVVVSLITLLIPINENISDNKFYLLLAGRIFFIIAITIPFDIRDITLDQSHRLETIPTRFGIEKAKKIAIACCIIFAALSLATPQLELNLKLGLVASGIAAIPIILLSTPEREDFYYAFMVEGLMIIQFVCVFVANAI